MKLKYTLLFTIISFFITTTGFSQQYSDQEIGFDVEKCTSFLKERGVLVPDIPSQLIMIRESQLRQYTHIKKNQDAILQKIKKEQQIKSISHKSAKSKVATDISVEEKNALLAFYNSTSGHNWGASSNWDFSTPVTTWNEATQTGWKGVTVTNGSITSLYLHFNSLNGNIPSEIGQLKNLEILFLANNNLYGSLPPEIGQLTKLKHIVLTHNKLEGPLPIEITQLSNLESIDIYNNHFNGPIPPQISQLTKLTNLNLSRNNFSGRIPVDLAELSNLVRLDIGQNELTGPIPSQLGQLSNLRYLGLGFNPLNTTIPPELGQLSKLEDLGLGNSNLTGSIPPELGKLNKLTVLSLEFNKLNGVIPIEFAQLSSISAFFLYSNELTGSIPTEFTSLTNLYDFNVTRNKLEGLVPKLTNSPYLGKLAIGQNKFRFIDFVDQYQFYLSKLSNHFYYAPQGKTDTEQSIVGVPNGSVTFTMCEDNRYIENIDTFQWYKGISPNGVPIEGANARQYTIFHLSSADTGDYYCLSKNAQITNPNGILGQQDLILERNKIHLTVNDCVNGRIVITPENPSLNSILNFTLETTSTNLTYKWTLFNLDDSIASVETTSSVTKTYTTIGNYKVNLVVTDENGCTTSFNQIISICSPITGTIKTGANNLFVNANSSFYFDSALNFSSYEWTFYDLNNQIDETMYGNFRIKSFNAPGNYRVSLTVTDQNRCKTTIDRIITVAQPQACTSQETGTIFSGENDSVYINTDNQFYFNTNSDQDLHYNWTIYNPDNTIYNTFTGSQNYIPGLNFTTAGTYKIALKITDISGCTATFNKTFTVIYDCITSGMIKDVNDTLSNEGLKQVVANTSLSVLYYSFVSDLSNIEFSWSFLSPNGDIIKTGNGQTFDVMPTTLGNYKILVRLTNTVTGCVNNFDAILPCVDECEMSHSERGGKITVNGDYETSQEAVFVELNQPIDLGLNRTYFSDTGRPLSFEWSLLDPNSQVVSTGTDKLFSIALTSPGFHKVVLKVTDAFNGCSTQVTRAFANQMTNGCTQTNERSSQVQELAKALAKKLLHRTANGETDIQINNSGIIEEFISLKPFITNSPKDKIYNYKTVRDKYNAIISMSYSFSPNREYDFHISIRDGLYTNGVTPDYLNYSIDKATYINISQFVSSNDFLVSCLTYNQNGRSAKSILEPKDCQYSSEIKNINFCPPTCTPITGTIKTSNENIFTNSNTTFSLETTATDLTYLWTIQDVNNAKTFVTNTANHTYNALGDYNIALVVTDQNGCSNTFETSVTVRDKPACVAVVGQIKAPIEAIALNQNKTFSFETVATGLTYNWIFYNADGTEKERQNTAAASQTFTSYGNYKIDLIVTDTNNCTTNFSKTINIAPICTPIDGAIKITSKHIFARFNTNFSFETSLTNLVYEWTFYRNDNDAPTIYNTKTVKHFYGTPGDYRVKLVVTDPGNGCSTTFNEVVPVSVQPACVNIVGAIKLPEGTMLTGENQTFSFETTATNFTYQWTLYGLNGVLSTPTTSTATQSYLAPGDYQIVLITTDDNYCTSSFYKNFKVVKTCTSISGAIQIPTETITTNQNVPFSFNTTATDISYEWTFYNLDNSERSKATTSTVTKSYTSPGNYRVKLEITGQDGCKIYFNKTVTITGECSIIGSLKMDPENVSLYSSARFTFETDATDLKYSWKLYDPTNYMGARDDWKSPNFYFQAGAGDYKITLEVTDSNGCTRNLEKIVNVQYDCSKTTPISGTLYNKSHYAYYSPNILIDKPNKFTFWHYNVSATDLTLNWELAKLDGTVITTATGEEFTFTPTTSDNLNLNLTIIDRNGCPHKFSRQLEVLDACIYSGETATGSINFDNENSVETAFIGINQTKDLVFRFSKKTERVYKYHWNIYNSNNILIASGDQEKFTISLNTAGFYRVTLDLENEFGCKLPFSKSIGCTIENSCTNGNPNSEIVKKLYIALLKNLISRSLRKETDHEINISRGALAEFDALKPHITNGVKDKIYNYATTRNEQGKLTSIRFSFSPDRDYDSQVLFANGLWDYDPIMDDTVYEFTSRLESEIYFNLSQFTSPDEYLISCFAQMAQIMNTPSPERKEKTSKITLGPNDCYKETEIRYIDFCPATACLPTIGVIQSGRDILKPKTPVSKTSKGLGLKN